MQNILWRSYVPSGGIAKEGREGAEGDIVVAVQYITGVYVVVQVNKPVFPIPALNKANSDPGNPKRPDPTGSGSATLIFRGSFIVILMTSCIIFDVHIFINLYIITFVDVVASNTFDFRFVVNNCVFYFYIK